jgi:hypothetical protein
MIYPTTLPSTILDRLNRLLGMEVRSVCAGHREIPTGQHTRWETVGGGTRAPHLTLLPQATSAEAYEQWLDRFPMDALNTFHTATEAGEYIPELYGGFVTIRCLINRKAYNGPTLAGWWAHTTAVLDALQNTMGVADPPRARGSGETPVEGHGADRQGPGTCSTRTSTRTGSTRRIRPKASATRSTPTASGKLLGNG